MRVRLTPVAVLLAAGVAVGAAQSPPSSATGARTSGLVVHEWGTLTSIAGADGQAVTWVPQAGPQDLPCFVERSPSNIKGRLSGTVRMETPVLYFYSREDVTVGVDVAFRQGAFTEWYPHALVSQGRIEWANVTVSPRQPSPFPVETAASHYYAARHTEATPLQVASQAEKFLFYRGVGQFQPPLTAVVDDRGSVRVRNARGAPIGDIILFENRRGAMAATVARVRGAETAIDRPELDDASAPPLRALAKILMAHGLFEKEAQAMVETWRDSWFEEGARLLYIVPNADVDAILPLTIAPRPSAVERVFVGRMELVTPATLRDVRRALDTNDTALLRGYGRFLQPIGARIVAAATPADRAMLGARVNASISSWPAVASSCR